MNTICWNCQGIGNSRTVFALHDYVRWWNPYVVFLVETKSKIKRMRKIKFKLGFSNGLIVPCHGRSGGITLLWSKEINLGILSFSHHHIDATITDQQNNFKWRFTSFYGHPETHLRKESWNLLSYLYAQLSLPWFCCEDFNEILYVWKIRWCSENTEANGRFPGYCECLWILGPWLFGSKIHLVQHAGR